MPILQRIDRKSPEDGPDLAFWCPGCKCYHGVWTNRWTFNGDYERPTFTPSLKVEQKMWEPPVTPDNLEEFKRAPWPQTERTHICHSVITHGVINFCADSTHDLAGKSILMEDC